MKQAPRQEFPPGWSEKKVRAVIAHYDQQTEEEGAAEIETAAEATGETWMSVPTELVGAVTRLIEKHVKQNTNAHPRNPKKNPRTKSARE
jgi:hypothetical protein